MCLEKETPEVNRRDAYPILHMHCVYLPTILQLTPVPASVSSPFNQSPYFLDSEPSYFTITYQLVSNRSNEAAAAGDGALTASQGTLRSLGYAVGC